MSDDTLATRLAADETAAQLAHQCAAFSYNEDGNLINPDCGEIAELIRADRRLIRAAERERIAKFFDNYCTVTISRNSVARVIRAMGDEK